MNSKLTVSLIVVIVFHLVGMIGMTGDHPGFFIRNTPLNLIISCFILLLNHAHWNSRQVLTLLFIFSAGFLVEVIGTKTGYLFGNYHYGKTLGIKFFGVPLVIGVNWMMQIYIAGNMLEQYKMNIVIKAILASILLVILDVFIEPVAVKFDYWQWQDHIIPVTNYVCWFFISFLFLSLFYKTEFKSKNPMSGALYIIQLLMFMILKLTK